MADKFMSELAKNMRRAINDNRAAQAELKRDERKMREALNALSPEQKRLGRPPGSKNGTGKRGGGRQK